MVDLFWTDAARVNDALRPSSQARLTE